MTRFGLAELSHLGGALGRPAEDGGALPGALERLHDAMEPWSAEGGYFNFAERPCDVDALLPPETCERLAEVKRRWDPDGLIRANHAVSLTPA